MWARDSIEPILSILGITKYRCFFKTFALVKFSKSHLKIINPHNTDFYTEHISHFVRYISKVK